MKNRRYTRKKAVCAVLAAVILMTGSSVKNCLAEETVYMDVQETVQPSEKTEQIGSSDENRNFQQEEKNGMEVNEHVETESEKIETVSGSALYLASGGSLQVSALGAGASTADDQTNGKHLKLNFSYKILGCTNVDSNLNVRKKRSTDSKIAGKLSNNTFCNVQELYSDGWARIKSGKISGYVMAKYLLIGEKAEQKALKKATKTVKVTGTSRLNVRSLPSIDSRVYTQLKKNAKISVKYEKVTKSRIKKLWKKNKELRRQLSKSEQKKMLETSNLKDWICVKYKGKTAFISKEYGKVIYSVKTGAEKSKSKDSLRKRIVKYAKKFVGNRYVYGGSSLKHGTDCSGFVMRVYEHFGYHLSRSSAEQSKNGKKIKRSQLKPGDLLFYKRGGRIGHVSMYIGNGKIVHASNKKDGIKISSVSYRKACQYVRIVKG